MARQYILRKTSAILDKPGWVSGDLSNVAGNYTLSWVEDENQDLRIQYDLLQFDVFDDTAVARAAMFSDAHAGTIKIKQGASIDDDNPMAGSSESNTQVYTMTSDDTANAITFNKHLFKRIIRERYEQKFLALNKPYAKYEQSIWEQQIKEVRDYETDSTVGTVLSNIATARGITVADLVSKINTKRDAYNSAVATLLGQQKALEDEVDACTTMTALFVWRHNKGIAEAHSSIVTSEGLSAAPSKITF